MGSFPLGEFLEWFGPKVANRVVGRAGDVQMFYDKVIKFLSFSLRLTGYGIHHCFARSVLEGSTSHLHYFALAGIAMASCLVLCPVVAAFGRRGGLLTFMIITALASLLQLGLLSREWTYTKGILINV